MLQKQSPFYVPPGGPPQYRPNPAIYQKMGKDNIYRMLEDFYLELEKSEIRGMFPEDMKTASQRSAAFFIFLLGGPPVYQQKYGPPMMRQRHLAFQIDEKARDVWLSCFKTVLEGAELKYQFPAEHLDGFWQFLLDFSSWMVNSHRLP